MRRYIPALPYDDYGTGTGGHTGTGDYHDNYSAGSNYHHDNYGAGSSNYHDNCGAGSSNYRDNYGAGSDACGNNSGFHFDYNDQHATGEAGGNHNIDNNHEWSVRNFNNGCFDNSGL